MREEDQTAVDCGVNEKKQGEIQTVQAANSRVGR